jgi:LAO/AO transport system kinase
MKSMDELDDLMRDFRSRSIPALARCITLVENFPDDRHKIISRLTPAATTPLVIGFTGPPGVGKSSLINQLLYHLSEQFNRIAVLAFDPSSSISKGALLGDRIRMNDHVENEKIFIRSFASRGTYGGLSSAIYDVLLLLSSFEFDLILIETVGIGQNEIEISHVADIVILVLDPLSGDSIQVLKAGVMEVADIYCINKSDVVQASMFERNVKEILRTEHKNPRIAASHSQSLEGSAHLFKIIKDTLAEFSTNNKLVDKRKLRFQNHVKSIIESACMEYFNKLYKTNLPLADSLHQDPYALAHEFLRKYVNISNIYDRKN